MGHANSLDWKVAGSLTDLAAIGAAGRFFYKVSAHTIVPRSAVLQVSDVFHDRAERPLAEFLPDAGVEGYVTATTALDLSTTKGMAVLKRLPMDTAAAGSVLGHLYPEDRFIWGEAQTWADTLAALPNRQIRYPRSAEVIGKTCQAGFIDETRSSLRMMQAGVPPVLRSYGAVVNRTICFTWAKETTPPSRLWTMAHSLVAEGSSGWACLAAIALVVGTAELICRISTTHHEGLFGFVKARSPL